MSKLLCFIVCAAAFSLAACGYSNTENQIISLNIGDIVGDFSRSPVGESASASADTSGDSSSDETMTETVDDVTDIKEIPLKFVERFIGLKSFKAVTSGQTDSSMFIIKVEQKIDCLLVKDGENAYFYTKSDSDLVHTELTAYYRENLVNYSYNDEGFTTADLADYLQKFGVYPVGRSIEGFSVTEKTVVSVEKLQVDSSDEYCFLIVLDPEKSADAVRVQAKEFGGLDDYPVFSSVRLKVTMNRYFDPVSVDLTTEYRAKKIVETACVQHYVVTYSDVNGQVAIPDADRIPTE